ncbi:MAG: hypothetical protein M1832_005800 [Thelocarpon impressellum]|nr:MAG: hypothetical protein M1832_005800 [Thelocarpon impressellum]
MAGKRLVDLAALLSASRQVARQHGVLRSRQLDVYGKTSSLAHAVREQTERVTLTARAAADLARRLNEDGPGRSEERPVPSRESTAGDSGRRRGGAGGIQQDHHYEASQANAAAQPPPEGELEVEQRQAERDPLPDGTIPPDGGPSSQPPERNSPPPQRARRLQREAESQIPSTAAEQAPIEPTNELSRGHDEDVFYDRSERNSEVLSGLPRVKIPKQSESAQEGMSKGINADVFYSTSQKSTPQAGGHPEQEADGEGVNTDIFHSPRIAKLLRGGVEKNDIKLDAAKTPQEHARLTEERGPAAQSTSLEIPTEPAEASADPDMHDLAADLADSKTSSNVPYQLHESKVPSSRFGRLWQYGGLATGMAFGAVSESLRRVGGGDAGGSLMLSAANMDRLVAKLSRMRGAALKLGQMMSFQDSKMLPAPIQEVLQRVQDSADYMPAWQRDQVLSQDLGPSWRDLFSSFDEVPMAAASIGQVHGAVLAATGRRVAVKVQYPGVSASIDSDLNNLSVLLTASRLLPKGLYLDKTIANARTELGWECDYAREAACAKRFSELLADETDVFVVPQIIDEASGKQVLTMEMMEGTAVTKLTELTQDEKDWIGQQVLRLCLREITEFRFMQTDPNWTNFLYNSKTHKLELLDFGASREYPESFIVPYTRLLAAAARRDRSACKELSTSLGYLTGHESPAMLSAHLASLLALAEPFAVDAPEVYDFSNQTVTERVRTLIPVMVRERLAPPPEETYSLHRKLSGAFLLCARLQSRVRAREMFARAVEKHA